MASTFCSLGNHTPCISCHAPVFKSRTHSHEYIAGKPEGCLCRECHGVISSAAAFLLNALAEAGVRGATTSSMTDLLASGYVGILIQGDLFAGECAN